MSGWFWRAVPLGMLSAVGHRSPVRLRCVLATQVACGEAAWVPEQQRRLQLRWPVLGWDKALERSESFCSLGRCFSRPS